MPCLDQVLECTITLAVALSGECAEVDALEDEVVYTAVSELHFGCTAPTAQLLVEDQVFEVLRGRRFAEPVPSMLFAFFQVRSKLHKARVLQNFPGHLAISEAFDVHQSSWILEILTLPQLLPNFLHGSLEYFTYLLPACKATLFTSVKAATDNAVGQRMRFSILILLGPEDHCELVAIALSKRLRFLHRSPRSILQ
jgi:hypothetical protein